MDRKSKSDISPQAGCPLALILLGILGYLTWLLVSSVVSDFRSEPSPPPPTELKMSKEEMMATFINLSGNLCAKVLYVSPELSSGERQVNCEEYRDSEKSGTKQNIVVYMVNVDAETVRVEGRT